MFTCTSCSEALSFTSPSLINHCGHVFHESCGHKTITCPFCPEPIGDLKKAYFSVSTCDNVNASVNLCKAKERIAELELENEQLRNAPDCDKSMNRVPQEIYNSYQNFLLPEAYENLVNRLWRLEEERVRRTARIQFLEQQVMDFEASETSFER